METLSKKKKLITSKKFTLDSFDWIKSLPLAVLAPVYFVVQAQLDKAIETGEPINLNWKTLLMIAVSGILAYLSKNFVAPAKEVTQLEDIPVTEAKEILKEEIKKEEEKESETGN